MGEAGRRRRIGRRARARPSRCLASAPLRHRRVCFREAPQGREASGCNSRRLRFQETHKKAGAGAIRTGFSF